MFTVRVRAGAAVVGGVSAGRRIVATRPDRAPCRPVRPDSAVTGMESLPAEEICVQLTAECIADAI